MTLWVKIKEAGIDFLVALIFLFFFPLSSLQVASQRPVVFFFQEISGVYERMGIGQETARDLTVQALDFIGGKEIKLAYTTRENFHLEEVRSLFLKAKRAWLVTAGMALAVVFLIRWRVLEWKKRLGVITKGVAVFFLVVDLVVLFFFASFFQRFHEAFFTPGTWQFGQKDLLTTLFPYQFWVVEAAFVLSFSAFLSTLFSFVLGTFLFWKRSFPLALLTFLFFLVRI